LGDFNFADAYSKAGLKPAPEIIRLRQEWFDKFRPNVSDEWALDLTRILFNLQPPTSSGFDWFRDTFAESDPSFSLIDNSRESAVLAACALAAAMEDGDVVAGLSVLNVAAAGNREPMVSRDLVAFAESKLDELAVNSRRHADPDIAKISQPAQTKLSFDRNQIAADANGSLVASLFKKVSDDSRAVVGVLAGQVAEVVKPIDEQLADLREEVNMLWWYVGGYSRMLNQPFADLSESSAATMAGYDLAALTVNPPGPIAARAILQRLISAGRKGKLAKATIRNAVDAFPPDALSNFEFSSALRHVPDICPVLTAFLKASEIGESPRWHEAYRRAAQLPHGESTEFPVLELSMQVYRESLLVSLLEE
jgi:hypothetical protein